MPLPSSTTRMVTHAVRRSLMLLGLIACSSCSSSPNTNLFGGTNESAPGGSVGVNDSSGGQLVNAGNGGTTALGSGGTFGGSPPVHLNGGTSSGASSGALASGGAASGGTPATGSTAGHVGAGGNPQAGGNTSNG